MRRKWLITSIIFEIILRHSNATPIRGHNDIGYECFFCPIEFPEPGDLKTHTMTSHKDLKKDPSLRTPKHNHYSVKMDVTDLSCQCSKSFDQLVDLMHHLRDDHDKLIHTDGKNYILPLRFASGKLQCTLCDTEFTAFRNAIEHMNQHNSNYVCDVCDTGFVTRASLQSHKRTHVDREYQCKQCQQIYNTMLKLYNHIRYTHRGVDKKNKCAHCGQKFSCLMSKNIHLVKEHGVAPTVAKCTVCDKSFGHIKTLKEHYKSNHLMIKNFKCLVCNMKFSKSYELKKHMVKHTGARDYKGDVCHKAYGRRYTLMHHKKLHGH